jgi:nitrogen regulatory protein PII
MSPIDLAFSAGKSYPEGSINCITDCSNVVLRDENKSSATPEKIVDFNNFRLRHTFCPSRIAGLCREAFLDCDFRSWESEMKKIEAVIAPWVLDAFKEVAPELGISDFELVEVYRSGCETLDQRKRLYRGHEFMADFSPRLRVEFIMFDDDVRAAVHQLMEVVHPESISVFRVDQEVRAISSATPDLKLSGRSRLTSTASAPILSLAHQERWSKLG